MNSGFKVVADDNIPFLRGRLEAGGCEVIYADQSAITREPVRDADAILTRTRTQCDASLLSGSRVRLVATATIGTDHIDTEWCRSHGIVVRNAPGCNAPGVAQYVWSSLLRLGFDASRHTLGIVGCGNVGSIVKEWGEQLGARILVSDPPKEERREPGEYVSLERLLEESDAVTLHTPLTREGGHATFHLLGPDNLHLLHGKILVNAARGEVVDTDALKRELRAGDIRTAIDTWENEPAIDRELLAMADYATPHIAGYSRQGKERATRMALEAVEEAFGIRADKRGLEPAYAGRKVTAEKILASYDPANDTAALRKGMAEGVNDFEKLRKNYLYREET